MYSLPHAEPLGSHAPAPRVAALNARLASRDTLHRDEPIAGRCTDAESQTHTRSTSAQHCTTRIARQTRLRLSALDVKQESSFKTDVGHDSDVKAVLFDMDGVLCDSEELSRRCDGD